MSYRSLEVWGLARELVRDIHQMTLELPKFEQFEEGSQIRRSIKSVKSNIAEGYGRRRYKQEFIRFLIYAQASCDETSDHLDTLLLTRSLPSDSRAEKLTEDLNILGRKLNAFLRSVELKHDPSISTSPSQTPASRIQ